MSQDRCTQRRRGDTARMAGFTLLEAAISIALLTMVMVNAFTLLDTTRRNDESNAEHLELQLTASQTLDRMVLALVEADREVTLPQNEAPNSDSRINYQASLGTEGGVEMLSDPARIWLERDQAQVKWTTLPGELNEKQVVWGRHVSDFLINELGGNAIDDNGNGLLDEEGLSFNIEANSVLIRLTLRKIDKQGKEITASAETRAAFRN